MARSSIDLLAVGAVAIALDMACGGPQVHHGGHARTADPRFEAAPLLPHRSEPATRARTGPARSATVALAVDHGAAQAREVTLELARALIEQDESALLGLLSRRVVVVMKADVQSSKEVAERCLAGARNLSFEPGLTARDLAEPDELQVELAEVFHADSTLPSGVDARDLAVSVSRSARRGPRNLPCLARLYVRPGPHPRVVGISR